MFFKIKLESLLFMTQDQIKYNKKIIPFIKLTRYDTISSFTFSDTQRVVSTGNKVIKCNKEVRVTFSCPQ